jgi:hypothetical protein
MKKWLALLLPLLWGIFILFVVIVLLLRPTYGNDRCALLEKDVRVEHTKYFGFQFPYWFSLGQLKQESCCRPDLTAFDGGMGVAQFMPKTERYVESLMGEKLDPYNPKQAIRMQARYLYQIHTKENWSKKLWPTYAIYNGGATTLKKEFQKAGALDWAKMKANCVRKKIKLKSGKMLDFCDVNYDYSQRVFKYGNQYRRGADGMEFW